MEPSVLQLIDLALAEDIGPGDVTAEYFVPADARARGFVIAREEGSISGTEVALEVFRRVDESVSARVLVPDGSRVAAGAHVMEVEGPARSLLTAERTALNFLQRLCGVASATWRHADAIRSLPAEILDTRKTTPGWRLLEKRAVVDGGGRNHRMGLYDRAMVKDNHLVSEGGMEALQASIRRLKQDKPEVEVELEADRLDQVAAFLELEGVDHILLDNMSPEELAEAVAMRGDADLPQLEASGGVTLETLVPIAMSGVDFISVGAITHSAPAMDLGLDFVLEE